MSERRTQRIVIIDDHPMLRKGVRQLVDLSSEMEIVGETNDGEHGLVLVREMAPDLVLLDLNMPGKSGLETLRELKAEKPAPKVVIFTVSDASDDVVAAMSEGADGYLLKDMDPEELLKKLGEVVQGKFVISPKIADFLNALPVPPQRRIVIVDDHPLLRRGLQQLASLSPDMEVIGEADNGEKGIALAQKLEPDLVLLDLNMPGMDGLETLHALKQLKPAPKVVILTVSDAQEDVLAAMEGGADGYLLKDMDPEEILDHIRQLMVGHLVMSPKVAECLARAVRSGKQQEKGLDLEGLTEREREILKHISNGESNKVIARELSIAEATVKVHVKHLLKKLGLKSRVEAAVWAVSHAHERE